MRYLLVILSVIGIFLFPWWVFAGLVLLGLIVYPRYIEGCVLALLFDLAYAGAPLFGVYGALTLAAVVVFALRALFAARLRTNVFIS